MARFSARGNAENPNERKITMSNISNIVVPFVTATQIALEGAIVATPREVQTWRVSTGKKGFSDICLIAQNVVAYLPDIADEVMFWGILVPNAPWLANTLAAGDPGVKIDPFIQELSRLASEEWKRQNQERRRQDALEIAEARDPYRQWPFPG